MAEQNFHEINKNLPITPPPIGVLPIIQKFVSVYKLWSEIKIHFPKTSRYTLGAKIDGYFLETIEVLFIASYLSKQEKIPYLKKASVKLDLLKFFLQIAWESKSLEKKQYIVLSVPLNEIGKMLGGWIKGIQKETPANDGRK